jgi:hypothetical protein
MLILPEYLSSPLVFSGDSCYSIFRFLCNVLKVVIRPFVLYLLGIRFYLRRLTDSDDPFRIPFVSSNFSYI